jgi:cytidylate kinase
MAIITISRGSYSRGKEVAEKVAEKLGYQCIAREVILEASKEFNIPEIGLVKAVHDAPSILERFSYGKEKFIAYFQPALLKRLQSDNVVYHGLAGHFYVKEVPHVLKVRIIADVQDRIKYLMDHENISYQSAQSRIKKDDGERSKWSQHLYGIDSADPLLYDLVVAVRKLQVDDVVDVICHTAKLDIFKTTPAGQAAMEDLVLSAEVKTALLPVKPDIHVSVRSGVVFLGVGAQLMKEPDRITEIKRIAGGVPGIKDVKVDSSRMVEWTD